MMCHFASYRFVSWPLRKESFLVLYLLKSLTMHGVSFRHLGVPDQWPSVMVQTPLCGSLFQALPRQQWPEWGQIIPSWTFRLRVWVTVLTAQHWSISGTISGRSPMLSVPGILELSITALLTAIHLPFFPPPTVYSDCGHLITTIVTRRIWMI